MLEEDAGVTELGQGERGCHDQLTDFGGAVAAFTGVACGDPGPDGRFDGLGGRVNVIHLGAGVQGGQVVTEIVGRGADSVLQITVGHEVNLRRGVGITHRGTVLVHLGHVTHDYQRRLSGHQREQRRCAEGFVHFRLDIVGQFVGKDIVVIALPAKGIERGHVFRTLAVHHQFQRQPRCKATV